MNGMVLLLVGTLASLLTFGAACGGGGGDNTTAVTPGATKTLAAGPETAMLTATPTVTVVAPATIAPTSPITATPPAEEGTPVSESLEYKLAVVNEGGFVAEDDPLVGRFKSVLDNLQPKCTESRQKIADMGVKAQQLLQNKGVDLSLLRVMQAANDSIPPGFGTQPCADIFAALVTLTKRP